METITSADIQTQRAGERLAAALEASPAARKQILALHKQAEDIAAKAAAVEVEQLRAFATLESLKQARAAATADLAELLQLKRAAENTDVEAKNQVTRLLSGNRANDPFARTNFLLALDSLARLQVLAPVLPELLAEKQATIERLDAQIATLGSPVK